MEVGIRSTLNIHFQSKICIKKIKSKKLKVNFRNKLKSIIIFFTHEKTWFKFHFTKQNMLMLEISVFCFFFRISNSFLWFSYSSFQEKIHFFFLSWFYVVYSTTQSTYKNIFFVRTQRFARLSYFQIVVVLFFSLISR